MALTPPQPDPPAFDRFTRLWVTATAGTRGFWQVSTLVDTIFLSDIDK